MMWNLGCRAADQAGLMVGPVSVRKASIRLATAPREPHTASATARAYSPSRGPSTGDRRD